MSLEVYNRQWGDVLVDTKNRTITYQGNNGISNIFDFKKTASPWYGVGEFFTLRLAFLCKGPGHVLGCALEAIGRVFQAENGDTLKLLAIESLTALISLIVLPIFAVIGMFCPKAVEKFLNWEFFKPTDDSFKFYQNVYDNIHTLYNSTLRWELDPFKKAHSFVAKIYIPSNVSSDKYIEYFTKELKAEYTQILPEVKAEEAPKKEPTYLERIYAFCKRIPFLAS